MEAVRDGAREIFISQLGFQITTEDDRASGRVELVPELMVAGTNLPRVSVLSTAADVLLGVIADARLTGLPLTIDLSTDVLAATTSPRLHMTGSLIKVGGRLTCGEARFVDEAGALVAYSWASFVVSPIPVDRPAPEPSDGASTLAGAPTVSVPFFELLGVESPSPGVSLVPRRGDLLQLSSTFQGGVVCAAGESAAESLLGSTITGLDTRYLAAVRRGALRATATMLGPAAARVEAVGTDDPSRIAAVMQCRSAPPAGALR